MTLLRLVGFMVSMLLLTVFPAFAQGVPLTDWKSLFTPEVWAVLLGVLSTLLTVPITSLVKMFLKTEGVSSVAVNAILNSFFAGLLPFFANLYSLPYALVASVLGIIMDKFTHMSLQSIAQDAVKP